MRVPPNKRHLVVNKEYSRLPYWTDDGFEDIQRQTSQKYVQDSFGAFAESENQLPYLSDADYQELEYRYQDSEFPGFPDFPDIPVNPDTAPKGTCYDLWVSMFGNSPNGFFPTSSQYQQLMEYAKKCPLIYVPHWCCSPSSMKISGPASVAPGADAEYTASGGLEGCSYSWDADRGRIVGGTYTAPNTSGSDRITVSPYLGSDTGKVCAYKDITIEGGCKGTAHATTPQMSTGASQTLYIEGGSEGDTYYWSTTSGSLSSPTGTSVTYTAPATNPNCVNNPTITVTCGGATIGTLTIAVNQVTQHYSALEIKGTCLYGCVKSWDSSFWKCKYEYYYYITAYCCDGSIYSGPTKNVLISSQVGCDYTDYPDCTNLKNNCDNSCIPTGGCCNRYVVGITDYRTAQQKSEGCCPAALL